MMVTLVICIFVTVVVADFLISHFSIFVTCFHLLFPFLIFHKYNINNYIRPKNFESRMWITFLGTCISLNQNSCNIILIYILIILIIMFILSIFYFIIIQTNQCMSFGN